MATSLAPAVQPTSNPAKHDSAHSRKHSEAEGVALLAVGGGALGFGVWLLLHGSGGTGPAAGPTITTTSLPGMQVGTPYQTNIVASGGAVPYVWQVVAGSLPPGIQLVTSQLVQAGQPTTTMGTLTGTPTQAGPFSFTIQATDQNGALATEQYTITVQAAASGSGCQPAGTLVQPAGSPGIYIVDQNGALDPIASKAVFDACGYAANQVTTVPSIAGCPTGPTVNGTPCPPGPQGAGYPGPNCPMGPGLLAKVAGDPAVWYADCGTGAGGSGCQKHLVEASAFYGPCGWSRQRLYPLSAAIRDMTPTGAPIYDCTTVSLYSCGGGGGPGERPTRPGAGAGAANLRGTAVVHRRRR